MVAVVENGDRRDLNNLVTKTVPDIYRSIDSMRRDLASHQTDDARNFAQLGADSTYIKTEVHEIKREQRSHGKKMWAVLVGILMLATGAVANVVM